MLHNNNNWRIVGRMEDCGTERAVLRKESKGEKWERQNERVFSLAAVM